MKIIIPVIGFGKAGGYRVLSKLADQLVESGHEVSFISSAFSDWPNFQTRAKIIWIDEKGKFIDKPNHKPGSFFKYISALRTAYAHIKSSKNHDLVLLNHSFTATFLPKSLVNKSIYYVQAYEPDYYFSFGGLKNFIFGKLSELSYKKGLFTIVNSKIFIDFKKLHSEHILYPGIDFNLFYPSEIQKRPEARIIIGTIGRTEPFKGSAYIYKAFRELRKSNPKFELHVAFGSPDIEKNIPGAKCVFPKNDEELGDYYRSLDFYICALNMHLGAFHYPVVEAMACGIPVISTSLYMVSDNTSFLIKKDDSDDIINAVKYALQHDDVVKQKSKQALLEVASLTWQSSGQNLLKIIREKDKIPE